MASGNTGNHSQLSQSQLDEARDYWLVLQATAEGYRQSVRWLERLQEVLDILGVLIAIWLVVVLWGIQEFIPEGDYRVWFSRVVNFTGTILAIAQVSLTIISWRSEWRGKTEYQRTLSNDADRIANLFRDVFQSKTQDEKKLDKSRAEYSKLVIDENKPLGKLPKWSRWKGFQHVGMKYPTQNVKCTACGRYWKDLSQKLNSSKWLTFRKCQSCGVVR